MILEGGPHFPSPLFIDGEDDTGLSEGPCVGFGGACHSLRFPLTRSYMLNYGSCGIDHVRTVCESIGWKVNIQLVAIP